MSTMIELTSIDAAPMRPPESCLTVAELAVRIGDMPAWRIVAIPCPEPRWRTTC